MLSYPSTLWRFRTCNKPTLASNFGNIVNSTSESIHLSFCCIINEVRVVTAFYSQWSTQRQKLHSFFHLHKYVWRRPFSLGGLHKVQDGHSINFSLLEVPRLWFSSVRVCLYVMVSHLVELYLVLYHLSRAEVPIPPDFKQFKHAYTLVPIRKVVIGDLQVFSHSVFQLSSYFSTVLSLSTYLFLHSGGL